MTITNTDTNINQPIFNEMTKSIYDAQTTLSADEFYFVDPQFAGNKLLISDSNGDIVEGTLGNGITVDNGTVNTWFYYGTCSTSASTQTKVVVCPNFVLREGVNLRVKFANAQTYNGQAKLNVNNTGAVNVCRYGTTASLRYCWYTGEVVDFVYDGTNFILVDCGLATTSYYGVTKLTNSASSTDTGAALVPSALNNALQNIVTGAAPYSTSGTYAVGDYCRYTASGATYLYKCNTPITYDGENTHAWNASEWDIVDDLFTQINNLTLNSLSNVTISNPTAGQNLTYDAVNNVWKNTTTSATVAWGGITGTLADQTDLKNALDNKYDASNPNGYTSNVGTVTSVNNTSPDSNGNVSITIPTVNNATLTIQKNGTTVKTFTANASSNVTANITVPTKVSDLTDDTATTPVAKATTATSATTATTASKLGSSDVGSATQPIYLDDGEPKACTNTIPTKISDLTDDTATYPIDKADTLTGLTTSIAELNYVYGVTSAIQTQLNNKLAVNPNGTDNLLDSNNKINTTYIPDVVLGQMLYAGTFVPSTAVATLSTNAKTKLGTTSNTITLTNNTTATTGYKANEGCYYICSADGTFASLSLLTGDWLISTGSSWKKIDNTDAVTGVKGNAESTYRIGNVNITADNVLPTQADNSNKFLMTNGTTCSWQDAYKVAQENITDSVSYSLLTTNISGPSVSDGNYATKFSTKFRIDPSASRLTITGDTANIVLNPSTDGHSQVLIGRTEANSNTYFCINGETGATSLLVDPYNKTIASGDSNDPYTFTGNVTGNVTGGISQSASTSGTCPLLFSPNATDGVKNINYSTKNTIAPTLGAITLAPDGGTNTTGARINFTPKAGDGDTLPGVRIYGTSAGFCIQGIPSADTVYEAGVPVSGTVTTTGTILTINPYSKGVYSGDSNNPYTFTGNFSGNLTGDVTGGISQTALTSAGTYPLLFSPTTTDGVKNINYSTKNTIVPTLGALTLAPDSGTNSYGARVNFVPKTGDGDTLAGTRIYSASTGAFCVQGIPSADGTTETTTGSTLAINPYASYVLDSQNAKVYTGSIEGNYILRTSNDTVLNTTGSSQAIFRYNNNAYLTVDKASGITEIRGSSASGSAIWLRPNGNTGSATADNGSVKIDTSGYVNVSTSPTVLDHWGSIYKLSTCDYVAKSTIFQKESYCPVSSNTVSVTFNPTIAIYSTYISSSVTGVINIVFDDSNLINASGTNYSSQTFEFVIRASVSRTYSWSFVNNATIYWEGGTVPTIGSGYTWFVFRRSFSNLGTRWHASLQGNWSF